MENSHHSRVLKLGPAKRTNMGVSQGRETLKIDGLLLKMIDSG